MGGAGQLTILGSGTSTGVPMIGCRCPVCRSDDPHNRRTRCSALISYGGRRILVDTATDLRQQALREGIEQVDAVLITHTHADHVHGIDDLRAFNVRSSQPLPLFAAPAALAEIRAHFGYIFCDDDEGNFRPRLDPCPIEAPFTLFDLPLLPIPLIHGRGASLGFRFGDCAYLTDCSAVPEASYALLEGLENLVIDALRFRPHNTHFNIPQAIEVAQRIGARHTWLTHLSHDVDHARHSAGLPPGIAFAYDGQRLAFHCPPPPRATD